MTVAIENIVNRKMRLFETLVFIIRVIWILLNNWLRQLHAAPYESRAEVIALQSLGAKLPLPKTIADLEVDFEKRREGAFLKKERTETGRWKKAFDLDKLKQSPKSN